MSTEPDQTSPEHIQRVLALWTALPSDKQPSRHTFAKDNDIPLTTFNHHLAGRLTRPQAQEYRQLLTTIEEECIIQYLDRSASIGHPVSPGIIIELANKIRERRITLALIPDELLPCLPPPMGYPWLAKFRKRHPQVHSVFSRKIQATRFTATTVDALTPWFCEIKSLYDANHYLPQNIYNMDETGYAIGETQSSRVLVIIEQGEKIGSRRGNKKPSSAIPGRQEWVTTIECINAVGSALPPLVIFKSEGSFNTGWLPENLQLRGWNWAVSKSGWSNNEIAFKWLTEVFHPNTIPANPDQQRRLLIVDGHASHVQARFIAFCMANAIDLMILPPHSSHVTQPLDVGVFRSLKQSMAKEVNRFAQYDSSRIQRYTWVRHLAVARSKAMTEENIRKGWRYTGLFPYIPHTVLDAAPQQVNTPQTPTRTPLATLSIEKNSFLAKHANTMSPEVKDRVVDLYSKLETVSTEKTASDKENVELRKVLAVKKRRTNGVSVQNVGGHCFTTEHVYEMAKEVEMKRKKKKGSTEEEEQQEGEISEEEDKGHGSNGVWTTVNRLGSPLDDE